MKNITILLRRWAIFNKRLLKKPEFIAILLLIPLLTAALFWVSKKEQSGVLTVALGCEDRNDPIASAVTEELLTKKSMIRFIECTAPADAAFLVADGTADAAWIFPANMQDRIDRFCNYYLGKSAFVTVIQRESNVLLQLSHEKLAAVLFPYLSRSTYRDFVRDNLTVLDELSDAQLLEFYDAISPEGADMFQFMHKDAANIEADAESTGYLLAPLRGLFAILILLAGIAVSLFYMQDLASGKFNRLTSWEQFALSHGYLMTAVIDVAAVSLLALSVAGFGVSAGRELLCITLYILATVGFCTTLRLLLRDVKILGALIPILAVLCITLCPVFFRLVELPAAQYLLPPFYYLNAIYNQTYLLYLAIYTVGISIFNLVLFSIKKET